MGRGGSGDGEKWVDVELELAWLADGLNVEGEAKGGIKDGSWAAGWMMLPFTRIGKTEGNL